MNNNIVFAYNNHMDTPAIVADDQLATLPVANVQSKQRRKVWRTNDTGGAAGHYVIVPLDAAEFIEAFFMASHNFSVDATYRIRAVDNFVTGGTVTVSSGSASVTKSGGAAWTSKMDGTDLVYDTGSSQRTLTISTVTGGDSLTLSANAPSSYSGTSYKVLDFKNPFDSVNFPNGYLFDSGSVEIWKTLWGAGEDRAGFHGAGGIPVMKDLLFIRPIEMFLFPAAEELRFWKIHFFDANNVDGYLEAGRMFLGSIFKPTRNFQADFKIRPYSDPSSKEDSMGQVTHSDVKQKFTRVDLDFTGIDFSEARDGFAHMQNVVGLTKDFFISLEPDQTVSPWFFTTYYGRLIREIVIETNRNNKRQRDVGISFKESL
ncbi:MAG: hypothetical protein ACE5EK_00365 [Nitrospinales bacterium]